MTVLAWDPTRFDVGVVKMNAQHKGLVELMNAIHDRATAGAAKGELQALFQKLAQATVSHFADEEAYMESTGFADLKSHRQIHAKLLADFSTHQQAFDAGNGQVERSFFDFLSLWLRSHICHIDTRYAKNLARKAG